MLYSDRKFNIQFFAEGDGGNGGDPAPTPAGSGEGGNGGASGKVFSEDYVHSLRRENSTYRTNAKNYEAALRKAYGIPEGEELGDLNQRHAAAQQKRQTDMDGVLQTANNRLIEAELRSLEGYDHKLLAKLIDRSKINVSDDGKVEGLKEAAEAVATEFPAVKKDAGTPPPYAAGTGGEPLDGGNKDGFTFNFSGVRAKKQ